MPCVRLDTDNSPWNGRILPDLECLVAGNINDNCTVRGAVGSCIPGQIEVSAIYVSPITVRYSINSICCLSVSLA